MRPVNLIPPEQRRGETRPLRTGPLPYILLGALVLVVVGVAALVLTDNQIAERRDEIATLKREDAAAQARARRLAAYTEFKAMSEARTATIASLADSRFDWERVMRELALILPSDVWLVSLDATATSSTAVDGGGGGAELRAGAAGPALALEGCARGQEGVAGFVTALKEIDGVTRVGVESSELPGQGEEAGSGKDSGGDCRTREFIAKFSIVVAFDAAPAPIAPEGGGEAAPETATEKAESTSSEASESSEGEEEGSEGR
jgi:Tfp pilus assembly protein PilN